jgi:hypothetical protein
MLYRAEILGEPYYSVPGTQKGWYKVTLYFAEINQAFRNAGAYFLSFINFNVVFRLQNI